MLMRFLLHPGAPSARFAWICAIACLPLLPRPALADAGAVRVSQRCGSRVITVFTDPTPLRAGPVDVSVLVQDCATGEAILGDPIEIAVAPRGNSSAAVRYRATSATASNKLFQAANIDLPHAGWWEFTVEVQGPQANARTRFEAEVSGPLPPWQALWPWYSWAFLVIAVFAVSKLRRFTSVARTQESSLLTGR